MPAEEYQQMKGQLASFKKILTVWESYSTDSENRGSKKNIEAKKWNKTKIHILVTEEVGLRDIVIKEMAAITTILHCKEDKNVMQHYRRKPESPVFLSSQH